MFVVSIEEKQIKLTPGLHVIPSARAGTIQDIQMLIHCIERLNFSPCIYIGLSPDRLKPSRQLY